MEYDEQKALWEKTTREERLALLPGIRQLSQTYSRRSFSWDDKSDAELAAIDGFDALPEGLKWDLYMAHLGATFSADNWYDSYKQMTDGKEGR